MLEPVSRAKAPTRRSHRSGIPFWASSKRALAAKAGQPDIQTRVGGIHRSRHRTALQHRDGAGAGLGRGDEGGRSRFWAYAGLRPAGLSPYGDSFHPPITTPCDPQPELELFWLCHGLRLFKFRLKNAFLSQADRFVPFLKQPPASGKSETLIEQAATQGLEAFTRLAMTPYVSAMSFDAKATLTWPDKVKAFEPALQQVRPRY